MDLNLRRSIVVLPLDKKAEPPFVLKLIIDRDARRLAALLSDARVRVFDTGTLSTIGTLTLPPGSGPLRDAAFVDADPRLMWTAAAGGSITCWDTMTGSVVRAFSRPDGAQVLPVDREVACGPFALAVNAGGDALAAGIGHEVHVWDLRAPGERVLGAYTHAHTGDAPSYGTVRALAWHPTVPHVLLSAGDDGIVCVHDTSLRGDDALVVALPLGAAPLRFDVFGPHGALLWATTEVGGLSLWNVGSGDRLGDFPALRWTLEAAGAGAGGAYEPLSCVWRNGDSAGRGGGGVGGLVLLTAANDGRLATYGVAPGAVTPRGAVAVPLKGSWGAGAAPAPHAAAVRAVAWAHVAAAGAGHAHDASSLVLFTGDEDGRVCQWADDAAAALLDGRGSVAAASGGGGAGAAQWRRPDAALRAERRAAVAAVVAAGGRIECDAAAFGTRDADPVSDPEDGAPESALVAELRGTGGGGGHGEP